MNANKFETCRFHTLMALLLLTPLVYAEPWIFRLDMADAFTIPKRLIIQISALALMLSYVGELLARRKTSIRWCWCAWAFAFFLSWSLLSLSYCPSFHAGAREIIRWGCYGVIFFSAMNELRSASRVEAVVPAVIVPATIVSLLALAQYYGIDPSQLRGSTQKVYSTIGNPNHIASYLAVALPVAYWGWLSPSLSPRKAALFFLALVIGTAALLVTGARGGWMALGGGLAVSMAILRFPVSRFRALALFITLAALIVFLVLPSPLNRYDASALNKFSELTGMPAAGVFSLSKGGSAWRVMVWRIGWRMGNEHPLCGSGIGSFTLLYLDHLAEFLRAPGHARYAHLAEQGIDYAHNDYLQIWIELGLIGLALLGWFLISLMVSGFRSAKRPHGRNWITGALLAGCAAFLLEGAVSFPLYLWSSAVAFFIFAGMVASAGSHEKDLCGENIISRRAAVPLLIAAILFSLACIRNMSGTLISEVYLSRGIGLFYGGNIAPALDEFDRATRWQPHNGQARFFLALCLAEKGRYAEALREISTASRTFSRQAIYVQVGRIYNRLGNAEASSYFLDKAIAMLPGDPDAWLEKGNLLYAGGDIKGASACFRKSASLRPDYFPAERNLAISLDALGRTNEALRGYERALELRPREADLYVNMGALLARTGDAPRAQAAWQKALSIDPANVMARENLRRLE